MCVFLLLSIELCSPPQGTDELRGSCTRSGSEVPARGKDLALIGVGGLSLGRVVQASSSSLFLGLAALQLILGRKSLFFLTNALAPVLALIPGSRPC